VDSYQPDLLYPDGGVPFGNEVGLSLIAIEQAAQVPPRVLEAFTPDTRADKPVRSLHRKIGPRHVYVVLDAPKRSTAEFRAKGRVERWNPWTGAARPLRVLGETATGTKVELPLEDYEAQLIVFSPGSPVRLRESEISDVKSQIPLPGEWELELRPAMDNRCGDFRLPVTESVIGPEARLFRHAVASGDTTDWPKPSFHDSQWERVTHGFGPQLRLLGPWPTDADTAALEAALARLERLNPAAPVRVRDRSYGWRPYSFSWRQSREGDPGHQGWHGLKENVTDHSLCRVQRAEALHEIQYGPEPGGNRYYLWTRATVARANIGRILTRARRDGERPHASGVLTPAAS
jgi:hypothetical protein